MIKGEGMLQLARRGLFILLVALATALSGCDFPDTTAGDLNRSDVGLTHDKPRREKRGRSKPDRDPSDGQARPRRDKGGGGPTSGSGGETPGSPAFVTDVVDGDTIEVDRGSHIVDVRLIGIDTPETVHPSEPVECFGPQASAFTSSHLEGEQVRLEFDIERRDQYGRALAYVWIDGALFNRVLVARGLATVSTYPPNTEHLSAFEAAESAARNHDRGLWDRCSSSNGGNGGGGGGSTAGGGGGSGNCDPNYSGACIPEYPPDLDCDDVSASGFQSTGSDPHGFDGDADGIACE